MRNKRVFVSGGAGVIGTALVNKLLSEGADVYVGDLKPCPPEWIGRLTYRQGDLNFIEPYELLNFSPEYFFHLAATFERSLETYEFYAENFHHNVRLSHYLSNILKDASALKKIVFASSYLIYDPHLYEHTIPREPSPLKENSNAYPRNTCGAAKFLHELELRFLDSFSKGKLSSICARIFRVYGRSSKDIISRWIRAALNKETLIVYKKEGRFDYVFADDVVEGLLRLSKTDYSGVVNLGSGKSRSIEDVLNELKKHFPDLRIEEGEADILFESSEANMELFQSLTQWLPSETIESGIPKLIEYERKQIKKPLDKKNEGVLVTSISKKVPLLNAVKQASLKLGSFQKLFGCDSSDKSIGQFFVDSFWKSPYLANLNPQEIIKYCQSHAITAIIPTRDADLTYYASHLSLFKEAGISVMISSLNTINICNDKEKFSDYLFQNKIQAIPSFKSIDECKGTSFVVKEQYGAGSLSIGINLSKDQAIEHAKKLKHPIFQPYIHGKEWSIDLYRSKKGIVIGTVCRSRDLIVDGESQVTTTKNFPELEKFSILIADLLDLYGHAVLQVIEDDKGLFHALECNPRFGGASTASLEVGLDSFYWFFLECLEKELETHFFKRSSQEIKQIRFAANWILPWS